MCILAPLIHVNGGMEGGVAAHVTKTIARGTETAYFPVSQAETTAGAATRRATRHMAPPPGPVLIKRYDNRRLYHADAGTYLTLDDLAAMVEDDDDFMVREAATGEDITPTILKQIIRKRALHG